MLGTITELDAAISGFSETTASRDSPSLANAERRHLTVMFCDLVGSTALSSRLDPEEYREVIGAYHHAVAKIIAEADGFVSRYMGDGVLVYFGYPQAHEDDAERAVRAGLACIEAAGRLNVKSVKLQARVAIATGLVVVGDLIGEGPARSNRSSARRRTSPPVCKPRPWRRWSSSPRARGGCSVISLSIATSEASRSRASPWRCRLGRYCVRAPSPTDSGRCAAPRCPGWSAATRKSTCCCVAGRAARLAKRDRLSAHH